MLKIKDEGIILEKTNLEFENKSVLNPSTILVDDITHMFYRAINEQNISSIGYAKLINEKVIERNEKPIIYPEFEYELMGTEDPRITFLDGLYYLFYTAYDGRNAHIAYATSIDLIKFDKKGFISPNITYNETIKLLDQLDLKEKYFIQKLYLEREIKSVDLLWEKDASLFPKKINNQFALIHRIRPDMQIIFFNSFSDLTKEYWKTYLQDLERHIVLAPKFWYENQYIGGGCPPIETDDGWLIIYHAVEKTLNGKIYHATAALLDISNPLKVIGRLKDPLFSPKTIWEKNGLIDNVVFPSGAIVKGDNLFIYYGAADRLIAAKSLSLSDLLQELKNNPQTL